MRGALITPKTKHHGAILDPKAMGELLRAVDSYGGHGITRLAVQLSPHLMARPGELRQAIWPEFDLEKAVWKIPAERMKMGGRMPFLYLVRYWAISPSSIR